MERYEGDDLDNGKYKSTQTRRSSLGSYASDSVDYGKYKSTTKTRSRIGSYAGDSVDYGHYRSTKTAPRSASDRHPGSSLDSGQPPGPTHPDRGCAH